MLAKTLSIFKHDPVKKYNQHFDALRKKLKNARFAVNYSDCQAFGSPSLNRGSRVRGGVNPFPCLSMAPNAQLSDRDWNSILDTTQSALASSGWTMPDSGIFFLEYKANNTQEVLVSVDSDLLLDVIAFMSMDKDISASVEDYHRIKGEGMILDHEIYKTGATRALRQLNREFVEYLSSLSNLE